MALLGKNKMPPLFSVFFLSTTLCSVCYSDSAKSVAQKKKKTTLNYVLIFFLLLRVAVTLFLVLTNIFNTVTNLSPNTEGMTAIASWMLGM
jgi:hypothetical protein